MWQRQHRRFESDSNCVLLYDEASACDATVGNISLGGAFIKVLDGVPVGLTVGNKFNLLLFNKNNIKYSEHNCKIVRCDPFSMGVSFLGAIT